MTMPKMVSTLSECERKQLVNTIVRCRKREKGAKNRRLSEPASARGPTTVPPEAAARASNTTATVLPPPKQRPFVAPGPTARESTLGPGGPLSSLERVEVKTQKDSHRAEESDLAGALLRQASRQYFSPKYFHIQVLEYFYSNFYPA